MTTYEATGFNSDYPSVMTDDLADRGEVERGWDVLRRMPLSKPDAVVILLCFLMPASLPQPTAACRSGANSLRVDGDLFRRRFGLPATLESTGSMDGRRSGAARRRALIGSVLLSNSADVGVGVARPDPRCLRAVT